MTVAQQNHNHFQNSNRIVEFVKQNTESIAKVLNGDIPTENKLELVEMVNRSTQEIVTKWKEVIYEGPYTMEDISLFLLLDNFESKKA